MIMKVKEKIVNIFSIIFITVLFIMAFTFIIFHHNGSSGALKDAWSILGSFFGGIATLTTGYIAFIIFDGWKLQHNKQLSNDFNISVYKQYIHLDNLILEYALLVAGLLPLENKMIIPFLSKKI